MIPYAKLIGWGVVISGIVGAYLFHHKIPMSNLEKRVDKLEAVVDTKNLHIGNLQVELQRCQDQADVDIFETYYEGLSDANNTPVFTDFVF